MFCNLRIQFGGLLASRYGLAPGVAWHICSPIITQKVISRDMGKIGRGAFHGLVHGRAWAGPTGTVALGGMSLAGDKPPRYIFSLWMVFVISRLPFYRAAIVRGFPFSRE